jgi:heme-degrading monooxygenase HmoA
MLDENISELFRKVKGFHGLVTLLSREDSDIETILTMWENEESLKASETIFKDKALKLEPFIIGTPDVKNYRVFSAELRH